MGVSLVPQFVCLGFFLDDTLVRESIQKGEKGGECQWMYRAIVIFFIKIMEIFSLYENLYGYSTQTALFSIFFFFFFRSESFLNTEKLTWFYKQLSISSKIYTGSTITMLEDWYEYNGQLTWCCETHTGSTISWLEGWNEFI